VITFLAKKRTPEKAFMLVTAFGGNEWKRAEAQPEEEVP
jgi:hypothetical protein